MAQSTRNYVISEEYVEQFKEALSQLIKSEENYKKKRKMDDTLVHLNFLTPAPKECKCE